MKKILFGALILSVALLTACGGGASVPATPEPVPADFAGKTNPLGSESAAAGAELYKTYCLQCHGEQGHGDGPSAVALNPAPKNLPELLKMPGTGDDFLFWRISTGKPGTAMAPTSLTEEQIWQVVVFVRTLK